MLVERPTQAVIGIGNLLFRDEGVGVHAARALMRFDVPPHIVVRDGGTEGLGLMDVIVGLTRLVLLDCVRGSGEPGTIYCFDWGDVPDASASSAPTSQHQADIGDVLRHVALIAEPPRTTVIGVEPRSLDLGLELSRPVAEQIPTVCRLALEQFEL